MIGFDLVGSQKTTCTRRRNNETGNFEVVFFPSPPCCQGKTLVEKQDLGYNLLVLVFLSAPCSTRLFADVVFVLDSSTSIGDENWQKILTFVQSIAE